MKVRVINVRDRKGIEISSEFGFAITLDGYTARELMVDLTNAIGSLDLLTEAEVATAALEEWDKAKTESLLHGGTGFSAHIYAIRNLRARCGLSLSAAKGAVDRVRAVAP